MATIHLLLVDDERQFVDILCQRLVKRGFAVTGAYSAREAFERLTGDDSIDVVVLDVKMPGMDGIEATRRIRDSRPLVEIVLLTGHATVDSAVAGIKNGAYDYLLKPCDLERLTAKVTEAARVKRAREDRLLEIRMRPYISESERQRLIDEILNP